MQEQITNINGQTESWAMALLGRIDKYLRHTGMPVTKFGRLAVNDPRFVLDLRRGREPGANVSARVDRFIAREPQ